jgi:protein disulfide-isomerase A6
MFLLLLLMPSAAQSRQVQRSGVGGCGGDGVVQTLTGGNFHKRVLESRQAWIVAFVAPWCGHCQSLKPEFSKAAAALRNVVKFGVLDATQHGVVAAYVVRGHIFACSRVTVHR